ncbi:hypothetical protein PVAP13_4KG139660 [Panicum virgatum]|uniref:Protein TIC 214 n=1 Tax=Panicum virgatum TaxID=38727 RepID=A0A8T0TSJ1_PANVG|nr:hypothetical protein PVAP13_4KG139660 [Panicum virgatum]
MKIINSVDEVRLYYGFVTTFSIGKVIFTTIGGFIMGQLIIFISIYYLPLHLFFLSSTVGRSIQFSYIIDSKNGV